uniref:Uncharacterized protein n=1 Tax=Picea sitchensis TaxID=3332 RepID=A9NWF4_PICSI|nr:unknown [Picea sitchensis]
MRLDNFCILISAAQVCFSDSPIQRKRSHGELRSIGDQGSSSHYYVFDYWVRKEGVGE